MCFVVAANVNDVRHHLRFTTSASLSPSPSSSLPAVNGHGGPPASHDAGTEHLYLKTEACPAWSRKRVDVCLEQRASSLASRFVRR
ncbi:hypothetical protein FA13DRAFT_1795819 [Coprinellus micaceus]|uniref:Uncharacterized protein n=1 Tax=Coprinellus micaceus TaxID=71717 RepID=A0A4Y7SWU6_COPMI|nr:hypothetical protein FA13DRAFT_1795819 [Coprinellus micaceus]